MGKKASKKSDRIPTEEEMKQYYIRSAKEKEEKRLAHLNGPCKSVKCKRCNPICRVGWHGAF
jgi:hypothetical protein